MSLGGRAAQMAVVTFIGVTTGVYIFTPIVDNLKEQVEAGERAAAQRAAAGLPRRRAADIERWNEKNEPESSRQG
eukprot:m.59522 g.59522  ORF g.59522 m.59522 type:complete len:75 (-) comp7897_c1_seq1:99-323(-)